MRFARERNGLAHVRVFVVDLREERRMVARPRLGVQPLDLACGPGGMPLALSLELAGRLEQLEPELPDRLEHPEARLAVGVRTLAQEALLDE